MTKKTFCFKREKNPGVLQRESESSAHPLSDCLIVRGRPDDARESRGGQEGGGACKRELLLIFKVFPPVLPPCLRFNPIPLALRPYTQDNSLLEFFPLTKIIGRDFSLQRFSIFWGFWGAKRRISPDLAADRWIDGSIPFSLSAR